MTEVTEDDWKRLKMTELKSIEVTSLEVRESMGESHWNCRKQASLRFRTSGGAKQHLKLRQ